MLLEKNRTKIKEFADIAVKKIAKHIENNFYSYFDGYELVYDIYQEFDSISDSFIETFLLDEDLKELGYIDIEDLILDIKEELDTDHYLLNELKQIETEEYLKNKKRFYHI